MVLEANSRWKLVWPALLWKVRGRKPFTHQEFPRQKQKIKEKNTFRDRTRNQLWGWILIGRVSLDTCGLPGKELFGWMVYGAHTHSQPILPIKVLCSLNPSKPLCKGKTIKPIHNPPSTSIQQKLMRLETMKICLKVLVVAVFGGQSMGPTLIPSSFYLCIVLSSLKQSTTPPPWNIISESTVWKNWLFTVNPLRTNQPSQPLSILVTFGCWKPWLNGQPCRALEIFAVFGTLTRGFGGVATDLLQRPVVFFVFFLFCGCGGKPTTVFDTWRSKPREKRTPLSIFGGPKTCLANLTEFNGI